MIFAVAMICLVASSIAAFALTQWTHDYTWTITSRSFEVYTDNTYLTQWNSGINENLGLDPATKVQTFYFNNTGNVAVKISVEGETLLGALASWTPDKFITLTSTGQLGNLTLTLSSFTDTGSYHFEFNALAP